MPVRRWRRSTQERVSSAPVRWLSQKCNKTGAKPQEFTRSSGLMRRWIRSACQIACAAVAGPAMLFCPSGALAAEHAIFLNAPAVAGSPLPKLAVQFHLKLHLPEGKGLARL